jgi:hypothetical protein
MCTVAANIKLWYECGRSCPRRRGEYVDSKRRDKIIERHSVITSKKNGIHIKYCFLSQACFVSRKVIWSSGLIFYVSEPNLHEVSTAVVTFIRFCITITNFVCYLQGMEIFPTCLRQTGMSIANLAGNMAGVLAPYVVYLVRNSLFLLKYLHFMQTYLLNC